jgi:hypothetical protein
MSVANLKTKIMITAEEFFRNKIKELHPNKEVVTLSQELITAEQGLRWAHEFKQLHLHAVRQRKIMMTIHFKNGMTKEVIKQIGEAINKRVIEGCSKFQTFSDENGDLLLIVNLDEVVYVA